MPAFVMFITFRKGRSGAAVAGEPFAAAIGRTSTGAVDGFRLQATGLDDAPVSQMTTIGAPGGLDAGGQMQNSADRMRWFALAGYGSGALTAFVAIDDVAIVRKAAIAIAMLISIGAPYGIAVLFDLAATEGAAETNLLRLSRGTGGDKKRSHKRCGNDDSDEFFVHLDLPG